MSKADLYDLAETYRPQFPVFRSSVYLNSCSLGALSERARAALSEFADLWDDRGAAAWYHSWLRACDDLRTAIARLLGVDSAEIALAPSISAALSTISSAIDFAARPRVVTTELDFPTLVYQYRAKERLGVELIVLKSPDGVTVPLDAFAEVVDERTALVATSHVYFTTGAIQDVATLADIAHEAGALCLIDAYQSTGQLPVEARRPNIDFLVSGALKWLLGGPGLAFAYVKRPLIERLRPTAVSWFGVEDQFDFDVSQLQFRRDARRFELGTPAVPTVYTARAGLEIIEEVGIERIRARVSSLTEDLLERVRSAGLRARCAPTAETRSGIVMVEHAEPAEAVRRLADERIVCDHRPGAIRLSPHFYNTTEDGERAVSVLTKR